MAVSTDARRLQGVSKFERVELPNVPRGVADEVQAFIEGISADDMLSSRAVRRRRQRGTRVFTATSLEAAIRKAERSYHLRLRLRRLLRMETPEPNSVMARAMETARTVAAASNRERAFLAAVDKAQFVAMKELSRKRPLDESITYPIATSAGLLAVLKALQGIDYPDSGALMAHAQQRWGFIERGFGICLYDRHIPYLFCARESGNDGVDRSEGGRWGHIPGFT